MKKPNIILIMTDQQRYDSIGALNGGRAVTPILDKLAAEGAVFTNCFCTAPSCVPSRASFFNCAYPGRIGVHRNGSAWNSSWVQQLAEAGYQCINAGKMHTVPADVSCGFHQRFIVENKDQGDSGNNRRFLDAWNRYLLFNNQKQPDRKYYKEKHPLYETALGAYEWELDEKYHPDIFTGQMAVSILKNHNGTTPLFLQIGFPGPHPPYDPVKSALKLYDKMDIHIEPAGEKEKSAQPQAQKIYRKGMIENNHDAVRWSETPTSGQLSRLRKFYLANVSMIDQQVGLILNELGNKGMLDNTLVIFTSDHGDCLGDHGHIQKWTMFDCVIRVPMILWGLENSAFMGKKYQALIQQFDIAHTLLELAGADLPSAFQSISLTKALQTGAETGRSFVFAEHVRCNVMNGTGFMSMVRGQNHKLVHYLDDNYGELYDLKNNPEETINQWENPAYEQVKQRLIKELLNFKCGQPRETEI
jgi:arylsulfatase A-like enzyme